MNETNIEYTDCLNMPGIRRLFYVFKDSVLFMAPPRHINQWRIANITLKLDKKWGRIYFLPENTSFDENPKVTEQGDIYTLLCSGLLLSTNELATTLLMALSRKELVLLIEDEKGNLRVLGNQNKGVKISISQSSSNIAGDVFGYQFGINFISDGPAYWFNGEIEESEEGGELLPPPLPPGIIFKHSWDAPFSFCGTALEGTNESSSSWEISRIEVFLDGTTDVKTATGAWTNRLTLIYT